MSTLHVLASLLCLGGDISERVLIGRWVVAVCAIGALSGRGGVHWGGGRRRCIGHQKCLCHLESPALVRNVRPLRAEIMYWMRQLYF